MKRDTFWKYPEYVKFYASFFLGNVGDWFDFFAIQIILAHQFNATPNQIVLGLLAYMLPLVLFASIAGSVADKLNRKGLLIITDFLAGILTVLLIFCSNMVLFLAVVFLRSSFVAFNAPVQKTMSKALLPTKLQLQASSYESIIFQLCRIIGPMCGAVVVAISSPQYCLGINAISFFLSSIILLFLKPLTANFNQLKKEPDDQDEGTTQSNFKMALNVVKKSQLLRYFIPFIIAAAFFVMMVELQLVILVRDIIPTRPDIFGFVIGFSALGSLLIGLWLSRKKTIVNFGAYLALCFCCVAVGYTVMGLYQTRLPLALFYLASMLSGVGVGVISVLLPYAIRVEIDGEKLGRVSGVLSMITGMCYLFGVIIGGSVITLLGARDAFLTVAGILAILFVLSALFQHKMKSLTTNPS
jgi:MFS family permease